MARNRKSILSLSVGFKTDVGRKRKNNQDSFVVVRGAQLNGELDGLFVVADGMGGRQGGEVASSIVVETLPECVSDCLAARNGSKESIEPKDLLTEAIVLADRRVRKKQDSDPMLSGMGTTCVAAILDGDLLTIANIGDSRIYMMRQAELTQLTDDHSEVWREVMAGNMTREEAQRSRFRNVITRAIGAGVESRPDLDTIPLIDGDSILLCSDGLTSEIEDIEIARVLADTEDIQAACDKLIQAALDGGGSDNITVVALRYGSFIPVELNSLRVPGEWRPEKDAEPFPTWSEADRTNVNASSSDVISENSYLPTGESTTAPVRQGVKFEPAIAPTPELELSPTPAVQKKVQFVNIALIVALAIAIIQTLALLYIWKFHDLVWASRPVPVEFINRPIDRQISYSPPVVLLKQVRDTPLTTDSFGNPVVVLISGKIAQVDSLGKANLTGMTSLPPLTNTIASVHPGAKAPSSFLLTSDTSGNLYQIYPDKGEIIKRNVQGKSDRVESIHLTRPTALAVNSFGDIFIIDNQELKKISAGPRSEKADPLQGPTSSTDSSTTP